MQRSKRLDGGNQWTVPLGGGVGKIFKIGGKMLVYRHAQVMLPK